MLDATNIVAQVPTHFYVIIGSLILLNFGTIVSIVYGIGKVIWFISKLDSRVGVLETDQVKDINAAFQKIKRLEETIKTP